MTEKPPTLEQVRRKIDKSGLSIRQFSRLNGIPSNTLNHYLKHRRKLPKKFYSIFKRRATRDQTQHQQTAAEIKRIAEIKKQLYKQ